MCAFIPIAMAAVSMIGAAAANRTANKQIGAKIAAQNAQKQELIRQNNYQNVAIDQQTRDQYDQAVATLTENNINAIRNQGMLEAAFGESGLSGRSVDAVLRDTQGQIARSNDSTRASFENQFRGAQYNKETGTQSAVASVNGMPQIVGPSALSQNLGVINAGLSGAAAGYSMSSTYTKMNSPKTTGANG